MSNCVKVFVRSRKKEFHPDKTPKALNPMSYAVRKHLSVNVLASAIALLSSVASPMAYALGLGQMNVQSALGEPLKAEIDILELDRKSTRLNSSHSVTSRMPSSA